MEQKAYQLHHFHCLQRRLAGMYAYLGTPVLHYIHRTQPQKHAKHQRGKPDKKWMAQAAWAVGFRVACGGRDKKSIRTLQHLLLQLSYDQLLAIYQTHSPTPSSLITGNAEPFTRLWEHAIPLWIQKCNKTIGNLVEQIHPHLAQTKEGRNYPHSLHLALYTVLSRIPITQEYITLEGVLKWARIHAKAIARMQQSIDEGRSNYYARMRARIEDASAEIKAEGLTVTQDTLAQRLNWSAEQTEERLTHAVGFQSLDKLEEDMPRIPDNTLSEEDAQQNALLYSQVHDLIDALKPEERLALTESLGMDYQMYLQQIFEELLAEI